MTSIAIWQSSNHCHQLSKKQAREEIAQEHGLKVVNGKIPLPDLRIEYETRDHEQARVDLELATRDYRGQHLAEKGKAGFSIYASADDAPRVRAAASRSTSHLGDSLTMKIQTEHVTGNQAALAIRSAKPDSLYVVAIHSGYFTQSTCAAVQRQPVRPHCPRIHQESTLEQEHLKESKHQNNARVYQLTYRPMYAAIGRENHAESPGPLL